MKLNSVRLKSAIDAMGWHFGVSAVVVSVVAALVFFIWFPYPYRELAGGTGLFFLVLGVDLVCGPLMTLVLFNPAKPRRELVMDLSMVAVLQIAALAYGMWTVYLVRPLFLVHELDRFKVVALNDLDPQALSQLPDSLTPQFFKGPVVAGLRAVTKEEREKVMFESLNGGRDYGERPEFYAPYDREYAVKAYQRARSLNDFGKKHPVTVLEIQRLQTTAGAGGPFLRYLPIIARKDWVAVINSEGEILNYLQGDGF